MSSPHDLLPHLFYFVPEAFGDGFTPYGESPPLTCFGADMGKSEKIKGLRLTCSAFLTICGGKSAKLDESGFSLVQTPARTLLASPVVLPGDVLHHYGADIL